jgi:hypothetical protein
MWEMTTESERPGRANIVRTARRRRRVGRPALPFAKKGDRAFLCQGLPMTREDADRDSTVSGNVRLAMYNP